MRQALTASSTVPCDATHSFVDVDTIIACCERCGNIARELCVGCIEVVHPDLGLDSLCENVVIGLGNVSAAPEKTSIKPHCHPKGADKAAVGPEFCAMQCLYRPLAIPEMVPKMVPKRRLASKIWFEPTFRFVQSTGKSSSRNNVL